MSRTFGRVTRKIIRLDVFRDSLAICVHRRYYQLAEVLFLPLLLVSYVSVEPERTETEVRVLYFLGVFFYPLLPMKFQWILALSSRGEPAVDQTANRESDSNQHRTRSTRCQREPVAKRWDEPAGLQQPPQTSQLSKITVSRGHAFEHSVPPHTSERVILIFYCVSLGSPLYLEVGVRARLFKSSVARRAPLSFFLPSFRPILARHSVSLSVTRNTRALRNRATPAAGQA